MAVMDEFKEERAALKNGTFKQKLEYFWDYYKLHTIGTIAVILILASVLNGVLNHKEEVFYAAILNSVDSLWDDSFVTGFMEYAQIDPDTSSAFIDSSLDVNFDTFDQTTIASMDKLMAYIAAAQLDVIVAGDELFEHYANENTFLDLRDVLTAEQLETYEPYFYYVDRTLIAQIEEASSNLDSSFNPEIPDPTRPDLMDDPIPVGIFVDSSQVLTDSYYLSDGERIVAGLLINSTHRDISVTFIEYLFHEE